MTLTTEHNRIAYTGNGATTVFPYDFLILDDLDLLVYLDGVEQIVGYSVSGVGLGSGGNVTFAVAPGSGVAVVFLRETDPTQQVNLIEGDRLPAESVEGMFDRMYALGQDLLERSRRSVKVPPTSAEATTDVYLPDPALPGNQDKALFINGSGDLETRAILPTDIASPITAKGDLIQGGNAGAPEKLGIGLTGEVLTVIGGKAAWATASDPISKTILDAKGDLITATAADTPARKAAGANGAMLTADSTQTDGLLWTPVGAAGSILRVLGGMPGWLAPGGEQEVLGIASGVPAYLKVDRTLSRQALASGTTNVTAEQILGTYTLPASRVAVDGQALRVTAIFTFAANGNNKTPRIRFNGMGGTIIGDVATGTWNNHKLRVQAIIWRTGAATQDCFGDHYVTGGSGGFELTGLYNQLTVSWASAIDIVATGQNGTASSNDIVCRFFEVLWLPEAA